MASEPTASPSLTSSSRTSSLPGAALIWSVQGFTIPTLVIHGDSDAIVPFEVSGWRTAEAIDGSQLVLAKDAPHGLNLTHAQTFQRRSSGISTRLIERFAATV
jgi:pimeloyl-ACP methyl ester carboxylesterase